MAILDSEQLPPMKWSIIVGPDTNLDGLAQKLRLAAAVTSISDVHLCIHSSQVLAIARALEWRKQLDAVQRQIEGKSQELDAEKASLLARLKAAVLGLFGYLVVISCVVFLLNFWGWVLT